MAGGGDSGAKKTKSEPNVVPLCDILLVLLIIFMVVTPLIKKGANVKLPEATNTQQEPEPGKMITVDVKADGSVMLDGKAVDELGKLAGLIQDRLEETKQDEKTKVLLKADKECAYGRVTDVMDEIRRAEIEVVGLVAEKSTNSGGE
ncbi:MAG: ExbD/TolR family protein [Candidatus Omnitrophota bacterium]